MCIIFYNETGKAYDEDEISVAYDNNPHGVGFMWVEDGKVRTIRGLFSKDKLFDILGHFEGVPHALHLRWRTRGEITKDLCHPFRASHVGADKTVYLMHNGTFFGVTPKQGQSDTHVFAHKMQDVTLEYGTDMLFHESFLRKVEKNVKSFNKVIFLRDDGKVAIMNPDEWTVKGGIWYSNVYSLKDGYRKAKVAAKAAKTFSWGSYKKGKNKKKGKKGKGSSPQNSSAQVSKAPGQRSGGTDEARLLAAKRREEMGKAGKDRDGTPAETSGKARSTRRVIRRRRLPDGGYEETVIRAG